MIGQTLHNTIRILLRLGKIITFLKFSLSASNNFNKLILVEIFGTS